MLSALGLVLWLQTFVLLPDNLGQLDRSVIVGATTEAGHIVGALGLVADLDGDGVGAVLGGGDCDDLDASVHPGADDRPGDGIDQDCLGGDPTTARQRALAASRTVWRGLPPERPEKLSLVVISVDALRVDRAPGMEAVQRLAARGVSFEHAYAPYPSTILTFSSIFTGRAPSAIPTTRVMKWLVPRDDPSETLAATLARQGYRTTGLFFHHLFQPEHGLSRGFDEVWTESGASEVVVWGRSSADSTRRGLAALDAAAEQPDTPFFLWVHYYDPHEPYVLHPEVPAPADDLVARYDAEVAYTDQHMLGLIDRLLEGDLLDRTVVALTADHGESLGEQGRRFHASSLADEQVRVPLIIAGPGIPRGQTRQAAVSLMDLAPTLSAEVGASAPRHAQGTSFGQLLRTPATPDGPRSPVFLELHADGDTRWGVVLWPWKLVYFVESHRFELFDLERDPAERLNVYDLLPAQAQQLEAMLGDWISLVTTR